MKTISTFLLVCSLAANLALGYRYWHRPQPVDPTAAPSGTTAAVIPPTTKTSAGEETAVAPRERTGEFAAPPDGVKLDARLAAALHGTDGRELVAALRQSGFPPNFVRDILVWQYGDTTLNRRYAMYEAAIKREPWRSESKADALAREKALNDLDGKYQQGTRDAFGGDPPPIWQMDPTMRAYGFLPADKIEAVHTINNAYADMARNAAKGGSDPKVLQLLYSEQRSDLAKILTPAELDQYDLSFSPTADALRRQLAAFQPTEGEFRALYTARTDFSAKQPSAEVGRGPGAADDPQRAADESALAERYRAALGPERYAEFQRSQDAGYRASYAIAEHYRLPVENAAAVFDLQQSARRELERLGNGATAADHAAVQTLLQSTKADLTRLLGAQGANDYLKVAGAWLDRGAGAGTRK